MADKKVPTSLRDTLKELVNPASTVKFDDSDDEFTFAKVETNAEIDASSDAPKEFGNLQKKAAFQDEDYFETKYRGNKISRKKLEGWIEEDSDSDRIEEYLGSSDDAISDNQSDDSEEEDEDLDNVGDNSNDIVIDGTEDVDENIDDGDESIDDGDEDSIHDSDIDGAMTFDVNSIPNDLLQGTNIANVSGENAEDEEESDNENIFKTKQSDDKRKGKATKLQLKLLDSLLEGRIRLQKSLQLTNTLPQHDKMEMFRQEGSSQVKDRYKKAQQSMTELLNNLLKLQESMFSSNSETANILLNIGKDKKTSQQKKNAFDNDEEILSDSDQGEDEEDKKSDTSDDEKESLKLPSKRKHTLVVWDYEEELNKRHKAFEDYRDTTITKWNEKTKLMSGKMNKDFSGFERSTLQQIKQVMTDNERLIKRTQLKRTPYKVIGKKDDNEDISHVDSHLKDYDNQIFDDGDFYHEMLKELIERKSDITSDDPVASGRKWLELQQLRTKIKRKIDTRASKGRKVRYQVHSKLVNFMAPYEVGTMSDQARNDLFASLFGGMNSTVAGR